MAAIVSLVFSWFSPIGLGGSMSPFLSGFIGILTLCAGPFLPVLCSARTGRTDLDVSDASKRPPLYALGLTSYAAGAALFLALDNRIMFVLALAYICVGLSELMITPAWKISAHTAGTAGPTTALVFVFGPQAFPLYVLSITMVWCRARLGAHTLSQGVAGMVVAIIVTSFVYQTFYP